jgi:hypothetical protein
MSTDEKRNGPAPESHPPGTVAHVDPLTDLRVAYEPGDKLYQWRLDIKHHTHYWFHDHWVKIEEDRYSVINQEPPTRPEGYRAGTVAHQDETASRWLITSPHHPLFSTATMVATHFWRGDKWCLIWEDEE